MPAPLELSKVLVKMSAYIETLPVNRFLELLLPGLVSYNAILPAYVALLLLPEKLSAL